MIIIFIASVFYQGKKSNTFNDNNVRIASYCDSSELTIDRSSDKCDNSTYTQDTPNGKIHQELYKSRLHIIFYNPTDEEEINTIADIYGIKRIYRVSIDKSRELASYSASLPKGYNCYDYFEKIELLESEPTIKKVYPFLKRSGSYEGMRNRYRAKLKDINDKDELECLANLLNSKIVSENEYMPTIFKLELNDNSDLNVIEVSNYLYNTGLFEFVQPSYLSSIESFR